jgi:hypothetical protein
MQEIDQGDGTAMTAAVPNKRWQGLASDGSPQRGHDSPYGDIAV